MNVEVHPDPFASEEARPKFAQTIDDSWFAARPSSRPPRPFTQTSTPPPPVLDDAVADDWFR